MCCHLPREQWENIHPENIEPIDIQTQYLNYPLFVLQTTQCVANIQQYIAYNIAQTKTVNQILTPTTLDKLLRHIFSAIDLQNEQQRVIVLQTFINKAITALLEAQYFFGDSFTLHITTTAYNTIEFFVTSDDKSTILHAKLPSTNNTADIIYVRQTLA